MAEKQSTSDYWEARYAAGGNSGKGSGGVFAEFKAEIVNTFVREHDIASVIDFGCGDGAQLALAEIYRQLQQLCISLALHLLKRLTQRARMARISTWVDLKQSRVILGV